MAGNQWLADYGIPMAGNQWLLADPPVVRTSQQPLNDNPYL